MKFFLSALLLLSAATVSAAPIAKRAPAPKVVAVRDVPELLVVRSAVSDLAPDFGFSSGVNPTGTGDCDGAVNGPNGQPIKIPCFCPPPRGEFLAALEANVAAGHAVNNPGVQVSYAFGDSNGDKIARIQASLITLQNMRGPGVGCPAASTTLLAQQRALGG
jgi:hypothetical protein